MNPTEKIWNTRKVEWDPISFVEEADGSISGGGLLYRPEKFLSLVNHDGTLTYEEGRDYVLEGERIVRTPESRIPVLARDVYTAPYDGNPMISWLALSGRERFMRIFPELYTYQVHATYETAEEWTGFRPGCGRDALSRSFEKLQKGGEFHLMFFGDSITAGWEASGCDEHPIDLRTGEKFHLRIDRYPHLPSWPEQVTRVLREAYPQAEIQKMNRAAGGSKTEWGVTEAERLVCPHTPDLMILGFGMNSLQDPPEKFIAEIEAIIEKVRAASPDCDVLVFSPMVPNSEVGGLTGHKLKAHEAALLALAERLPGVAAAPVYSTFEEILNRGKSYYEISGNCINHPNDFSVRVYAQTILTALGF